MNYGLLISGELDRDRLAAALAEMLGLPAGSVDVGDDGDDDRNWAAPVTVTVASVAGDLRLHLDVYLDATVPGAPAEPIAAAWLAGRLRTVVGYEAAPHPPSAYWLVGPDGERTRARIYEEDSDGAPVYRIDAVERPLGALPGLPVAPLPEVIRGYRMATPTTDGVRERLKRRPAADEGAPAVRDTVNRLGAWEAMVARLAGGWPPDGWYPARYYREDLETRNELAAAAGALPQPVRLDVSQALDRVDRRFIEATEDDGGRALEAETGPVPAGPSDRPEADRWWWRRVPRPLPWLGTPGGPNPAGQ